MRVATCTPTASAPSSAACVQLGGDFAFASATWQIAEAHSRHAPTYVYRYDYAPRTLHWAGLGATHAMELLAVFDTYHTSYGALLTAVGDRASARRVSRDVQRRWREFSVGSPRRACGLKPRLKPWNAGLPHSRRFALTKRTHSEEAHSL